MAFEPRLDYFLKELSTEGRNPLGEENDLEERAEALWYLDQSRASMVHEELKKLSEEKQQIAVKNLASAYPLSKHLLQKLLADLQGSDHDFILGFTQSGDILQAIRQVLQWVKEQTGSTTHKFGNYQKELEQLEGTKADLERQSEEYRDYRMQKETLEKEIEQLKRDNDEEQQKRALEDLHQEKNSLERLIREKKAEHSKAQTAVLQMKKELDALEKEGTFPDTALLHNLLAKFPEDAEDGK